MILVTGAGGHLGANLLRRVLAERQPVRALIHTERDLPSLEGLAVEHVIGDLRDPAIAAAAVNGCRQVYHCAAKVSTTYRDRDDINACNVLGARKLLLAALRAGVEKVVVTSSFSAVGIRSDGPSIEDDPFNPIDRHLPYAHTKAAVEHECLKAFADGLPVVVAVSTAILGPYDFKPSRMGKVLIRFAARRLHAYMPGGFPFVAARDIAEGHVLAMEKGRPGQRYIFASEYMTFDRLMEVFAEVTGQPKPRLRIPPALMSVGSAVAEAVMPYVRPNAEQLLNPAAVRILRLERRADISKAMRELEFKPTSIEAAIREAYEWFVSRGMITPTEKVGVLAAKMTP